MYLQNMQVQRKYLQAQIGFYGEFSAVADRIFKFELIKFYFLLPNKQTFSLAGPVAGTAGDGGTTAG